MISCDENILYCDMVLVGQMIMLRRRSHYGQSIKRSTKVTTCDLGFMVFLQYVIAFGSVAKQRHQVTMLMDLVYSTRRSCDMKMTIEA